MDFGADSDGDLWFDFADVADLSGLNFDGFFRRDDRALPRGQFRLGKGFATRVRF